MLRFRDKVKKNSMMGKDNDFQATQPNCVDLISMFYRQMPPNTQLNWIKSFYKAKQKQCFGEKVEDYKD